MRTVLVLVLALVIGFATSRLVRELDLSADAETALAVGGIALGFLLSLLVSRPPARPPSPPPPAPGTPSERPTVDPRARS